MKKFFSMVIFGVIWASLGHATLPTNVNIVNEQSSLCLDISGQSSNPGAGIIQNTCNSSSNTQLFSITYPNAIYANIVAHNGLCLTISGSLVNGAPIVQLPCNSSNPQQQFLVATNLSTNYVAFQALNWHDQFCLSIQGGSSAPNTPLILWHCLDYDPNKWFLFSTPAQ